MSMATVPRPVSRSSSRSCCPVAGHRAGPGLATARAAGLVWDDRPRGRGAARGGSRSSSACPTSASRPTRPPADRVPDDRNAFVLYRQAAEQFRDMSEAEGKSFTDANLSWSAADADAPRLGRRACRGDRAAPRGVGTARGPARRCRRGGPPARDLREARGRPATVLDRRRGAVRGRAAPGLGRPGRGLGLAQGRRPRQPAHGAGRPDDPGPRHRDHPRPVRPRAGRRVGRGPGGRRRPAPAGARRPGRRRGADAAGLAHLPRGISGRRGRRWRTRNR